MKITIIKYRRPSDSSKTDNYFALNLGAVDKIVFEKQLLNSLPIFREEWTEQDNVEQIKTGYFDMVLPLGAQEVSAAGKKINDFFFDVGYNFNNLRFLVIVETDNQDRNYSGFIDTGTVESDKTIIDGKYHLTFSVIGIDKEAAEWMKQIMVQPIGSNPIDFFESDYLPNWLYKDVNLGDRLRLDNRLDLEGRVGKTLYVNRNLETSFFVGGLNRGYSVFAALKSFVKELGFRFKLRFRDMNDYFPQYDLVLFWRSEGLTELDDIHVDKYLNDKESYYLSDNKYILIKISEFASSDIPFPPEFKMFTGLLFSRDEMYYTGLEMADSKFGINTNTNILDVIINGQYVKQIKYERVHVIENEFHAQDIYQNDLSHHNMVFAKIINYLVYPNGWDNFEDVMVKTAGLEYKYLLEGAKKIQKLKVKVPEESNLALSTRAIIKNENYVCERINSYDIFNKTMETEWIQQ